MVAAKTAPELRHNAVGLGPVIFQSLTVVAPAAGVATALPLATSYAGGATVLAIIFAIIVTGLMAITISQLARHLPSAGGLYTYVAHGLGAAGLARHTVPGAVHRADHRRWPRRDLAGGRLAGPRLYLRSVAHQGSARGHAPDNQGFRGNGQASHGKASSPGALSGG
jgi:hypothetical protein